MWHAVAGKIYAKLATAGISLCTTILHPLKTLRNTLCNTLRKPNEYTIAEVPQKDSLYPKKKS